MFSRTFLRLSCLTLPLFFACTLGEGERDTDAGISGGSSISTANHGSDSGESTSEASATTGEVATTSEATTASTGEDTDPWVCGEELAATEPAKLDLIFVIDNSPSMVDEIDALIASLQGHLIESLNAAALDANIIVISLHKGTEANACFEMPISTLAPGSCQDPPPLPGYGERFHQVHFPVESSDGLCKAQALFLADKVDYTDSPQGWQKAIRPGAFPVFVFIGDDAADCETGFKAYHDNNTVAGGKAVAQVFAQHLVGQDPHFGTQTHSRFRVHAIVGLEAQGVITADQPIITQTCQTATAPGTGAQGLAELTGGLRFSVCQPDQTDQMLSAIAEHEVNNTVLSCTLDFSSAESIDPSSIELEYTPEEGDPILLERVEDAEQCGPQAFWLDDEQIAHLCPDTCALVQTSGGQLLGRYDCVVG